MIWISIGIIILLIALCIYFKNDTEKINKEIENVNKDLALKNNKLQKENNDIVKQSEEIKIEKIKLSTEVATLNKTIKEKSQLIAEFNEKLSNQQEVSKKAFENYFDILDKQYNKTEKEFDEKVAELQQTYQNRSEELHSQFLEESKDLDELKLTKAAAMEALRKEQEIKEKQSFYCIQLSDEDLADIARLENIKPSLNKPRVLSMLVWSTFFQKPLKALSAQVLNSTEPVCGIYKITNQQTDECYIGQAVDIAKRWNEHAKCGLGIDTPAGNKLYAAMRNYGLQNFSFEIIEQCSRDQLNDKESFYIDLYQSYDYGYNSNRGINKK